MKNINKKPRIALISLFSVDLGVRYISSFLNSKGYSTDIISFGQLRITQEILPCNNYILPRFTHHKACSHKGAKLLIDLLSELKPDIIGISVSSTFFITASFLTQKIKERFNVPIVWGGIHPTLCPADCIEHADMVCMGEGEYPMYELAQKLENDEEITAINNLWIKHPDGSVEKNELRDLILDLDSLPYPDFVRFGNKFLIDRGKIIPDPIINSGYSQNVYPIMSSRGCHYHCSFCCNSVLKTIYNGKGSYLRRRSPENVIEELVYVRKNREVVQIRFWDDIFTYDQKWIERFHHLYIKEVALPFICYAHPRYTDKRIIQMLAEAGVISVDIGLQSGSESFCKNRFKREQSNEEIIEFANLLKKLGVIPRYDVIVDNPYESDSDADATTELLMRLPRPYTTSIFSLCYLPKTEVTYQALKDGFITEEEIEGRGNKGLNNFYMFIDLAKDKKRMFWDTLVAMAVSNFFSNRVIRRCKRSKFLRQHPRLLLSLVRLYLRISLISPIAIFDFILQRVLGLGQVKRENRLRYKLLFSKNPGFFLSLVKLYLKLGGLWKDKSDIFMLCNLILNNFENLTTETNNQAFRDKTKVDLLVFPKGSINTVNKSFYLKIRQKKSLRFTLPFNLLIQIHPLIFNQPGKRIALWEINFEIDDAETEMELNLSFPHLFFTLKGICQEASLREVRKITENGLYEICFFLLYSVSGKSYIFKNCILIHLDGILIDKENKLLNTTEKSKESAILANIKR